MSEKVFPGPIHGNPGVREAVCIHTKKVYDSCKDKDCLEDLRVFLTRDSQCVLDRAINVKPESARILWVYVDVEPVPFNRGFYTIDAKFFYHVKFDAFTGCGRPTEIEGICTFDKRVILFGSEGNSRIFGSQTVARCKDDIQLKETSNLPTAIVEVVEPIILAAKLVDPCDKCCCKSDSECCEMPEAITECFSCDIVTSGDGKKLFCTLGQFMIIKLERDSQLLIPCFDFCLPEKECPGSPDDEPCDLFRKIKFPTDEFFPPSVSGEAEGGCGK